MNFAPKNRPTPPYARTASLAGGRLKPLASLTVIREQRMELLRKIDVAMASIQRLMAANPNSGRLRELEQKHSALRLRVQALLHFLQHTSPEDHHTEEHHLQHLLAEHLDEKNMSGLPQEAQHLSQEILKLSHDYDRFRYAEHHAAFIHPQIKLGARVAESRVHHLWHPAAVNQH